MKVRQLAALILVFVLVFSCAAFVYGAESQDMARVVLKAETPDAEGIFRVTLTVYNATFNAFQFAFSYDSDAVSPVDSTGKPAASFAGFGTASEESSSWMKDRKSTRLNSSH